MRLISKQAATVDSLRVAVLAALNIADEFHVLKRKYDSIASDYNETAEQLAGALDEILSRKRAEPDRRARIHRAAHIGLASRLLIAECPCCLNAL